MNVYFFSAANSNHQARLRDIFWTHKKHLIEWWHGHSTSRKDEYHTNGEYIEMNKSILPTDTKQLQNERLQTKPNMKQTQMRFVQFDWLIF